MAGTIRTVREMRTSDTIAKAVSLRDRLAFGLSISPRIS